MKSICWETKETKSEPKGFQQHAHKPSSLAFEAEISNEVEM